MRVALLILGSVFSLTFIVLLLIGQKYDFLLDGLEGEAFPLKSIYVAGLVIGGKGNVFPALLQKLRRETNLLYSKKYEEYYARIILAQMISFALFSLAFGFLLGGLFGGAMGVFVAVIGVLLAVVFVYYFFTYSSNKLKTRQTECDVEFPDAISKLALIVNSGVTLHDAWKIVADSAEGAFYELMRQSTQNMENGWSDIDAIRQFGIMTNSDEIKKFATAMIQNIERGGGDLPLFLVNESTELWKLKKQLMLQKGEKAASALLVPITLMFAGIMLIVLASAVQSLSF